VLNPFILVMISSGVLTLLALILYRRQIKRELRSLKLGSHLMWLVLLAYLTLNLLLGYLDWRLILIAEVFLVLLLTLLGGFVLLCLLVIESIKVWRLESHSIGNLLLPLSVLAYLIMGRLTDALVKLPADYDWLKYISIFYGLFLPYVIWQFLAFLVSSLLYAKKAPLTAAHRKYFVVLGAGLVNGNQVGKLLGARIEKAVALAQDETIIIFSGGQGADEKVSEAYAMRQYAVDVLGFPEERTMLEDKSRTTYENLTLSSALIQGQPFSFFTSDYHVLRAAIFAKSLGLDAQGHGGKTALYYRIPAFIREFIAIINSKRKTYALIILLTLVLPMILLLILSSQRG
jgi:uncharacterized SAM-binding protein YcdF (DUF218 family)